MSSWVPGTEDDITPPVPPATRRVRDASGMDEGLAPGEDGRPRCAWGTSTPEYIGYHDAEWGFPVTDDRRLFEKICLEGFQSGLSWLTILRKRDAFRRAFAGFDVAKVSRFTPAKVERLLADPAIVRNRLKVESTVANARAIRDLDGSFDELVWSVVGAAPKVNGCRRLAELPAETAESRSMSKELKRQGFRFVGPTVCYSLIQATGLVNDHVTTCFRYRELGGR